MAQATARRLLDEIFRLKRIKTSICLTGGGGHAAGDILGTSGASSTLLELNLPYFQQSLLEFLGLPQSIVQRDEPAKFSFCSQEVSMLMAKKSLERARRLVPLEDATKCVGIGCTAALVSVEPRKGSHRAYVTLHSADGIRNFKLEMQKGARTRDEEDACVGNLIIMALSKAAGIDYSAIQPWIVQHKEDSLEEDDPIVFEKTFTPEKTYESSISFLPGNIVLRDMPWTKMLVLPGSFNPIHEGHLQFASAAKEFLQSTQGISYPLLFELSVKNVDKGILNVEDIQRRLDAIVATNSVVVTHSSLFVEKAALFPSCIFAIGSDTAIRLIDPKYYGDDHDVMWMALSQIVAKGCSFVVASRLVDGTLLTADQVISLVPKVFQPYFHALPAFRLDLSSTDIRKRLAAQVDDASKL